MDENKVEETIVEETAKKKKKMSKFAKWWIWGNVILLVLAFLLLYFFSFRSSINYYNTHTHSNDCYTEWHYRHECYSSWEEHDQFHRDFDHGLSCDVAYCDSPFEYAIYEVSKVSQIYLSVFSALSLFNLIMGITAIVRKPKKRKDDFMMQNNPVSIPTGEGEQVVLTRTFPPFGATIALILGILGAVVGAIIMADGDEDSGLIVIASSAVFIIAGLIFRAFRLYLTVTTKRVYFVGPFARRVNLPLHQISAVGTALFKTLRIGTSAGHIWLSFVPGYVEAYNTINALLNQQK